MTPEELEAQGVGGVMRAMAAVLIDRGHDRETVEQAIIENAGRIESDLWDQYFGPAADEVARMIGLDPWPGRETDLQLRGLTDGDAVTDNPLDRGGEAPLDKAGGANE